VFYAVFLSYHAGSVSVRFGTKHTWWIYSLFFLVSILFVSGLRSVCPRRSGAVSTLFLLIGPSIVSDSTASARLDVSSGYICYRARIHRRLNLKIKNGSHKSRAEGDEYGLGAGGLYLRFVCGYAEESCGRHPFDSGPSHVAELNPFFSVSILLSLERGSGVLRFQSAQEEV
jgi:hypothetical protein